MEKNKKPPPTSKKLAIFGRRDQFRYRAIENKPPLKVQNQARTFKDCADFRIGCFVPVDPSLEGRKYICAYYSRSKMGSMTQLVSLGGGKPPISQGQHR